MKTEAGVIMASLRVNATGQLFVSTGGANSSGTATLMATGTDYNVWLSYEPGVIASVAFSTDGVRPNSGGQFISRLGETVSVDPPTRFEFVRDTNGDFVADQLSIAAARIP